MLPISVEELAVRLGGKLHILKSQSPVTGFAWDSKQVRPGDAFLAIQGARSNGHSYVLATDRDGSPVAIVEMPVPVNHIEVKNLVDALAKMALSFREEFRGPVIGITGSAGKTTTKELTAAALSPLGKVLKSPGNKNTEYTSPLTWAEVEPDTAVAVVELAMRGFGQIAHLASFARPTVAMITNIGFSHIEQVGSQEGIARAKGEILDALPQDGAAILWADDPFFEQLRDRANGRRVVTFGFGPECDSALTHYESNSWERCQIRGHVFGEKFEVELPISGRHLALNAAAAALAAGVVGVGAQTAADAMRSVQLPPMRMETIDYHGAKVLMDNYNASPSSMVAAIESFCDVPTSGRRFAIIGEMKELGAYVEAGHRTVGRALASHAIDRIAFYGEPMEFARAEAIGLGAQEATISTAHSLAELRQFLKEVSPGDSVLVKGSRSLELERIFDAEDA